MSKVAYVDSSCLVAIAFRESGSTALSRKLRGYDELVSANLLTAELRAACVREQLAWSPEFTAGISWIIPDRPLDREIETVLEAGYLRGPDCWHLANALYLTGTPSALSFLTLDQRQGEVARALGFRR